MSKNRGPIENRIYKAIIRECEEMEHNGNYRGNGHHLAQRLTQMVSAAILSPQQTKVYNALQNEPQRTREIGAKCGLSSKQVSSQLIQMSQSTLLVHSKKDRRFTLWYK